MLHNRLILHFRPNFPSTRYIFTTSSAYTRFLRLKNAADHDGPAAKLNETYLRAARDVDPKLVIEAVEDAKRKGFAIEDNVLKEYIKALADANQIDHSNIDLFIGKRNFKNSSSNFNDSNANDFGNASISFRNNSKNPLYVVVKETTISNLWKLIRIAAVAGLFIAGIGTWFELVSSNFQKGVKLSNKIVTVTESDTTFDDVKGCDEVMEEIKEIVQYLKHPERFERLGAKLPKGVLLCGPPGTGKTLIARAIAGEAKVPFIHTSGSEFEEMFVGVGARRIRDLFKTARQVAPCIVFIDELDAVGAKRSATDHNTVRMTLNQLLVELDGFKKNEGIVVIGATNFPESLDKALIRPGRLDKTIHIPLPDLQGRFEILKHYSKKITINRDVDLYSVAKFTVGMTGAELFNILNLAAIKSSIKNAAGVTMAEIDEAYDRVVVGLKRKLKNTDRERKATAYHEGGHALVNLNTKLAGKLRKATILPRGGTLGATWKVPEEKNDTRMSELHAEIDILMGGMAAEEIIYGKENVSTGCSSDLHKATDLARTLVLQFGNGIQDISGPMSLDNRSYAELGEDMKNKVDETVQKHLNASYDRAKKVIIDNLSGLHNLANALVEFETLDAQEVELAIQGNSKLIKQRRDRETRQSKDVRNNSKIPGYKQQPVYKI